MTDIINPTALVDRSFYFIIGFSFVFLFAITLVMIYFVIRYRRSRHQVPADIQGVFSKPGRDGFCPARSDGFVFHKISGLRRSRRIHYP
jgi:hypothetical protein